MPDAPFNPPPVATPAEPLAAMPGPVPTGVFEDPREQAAISDLLSEHLDNSVVLVDAEGAVRWVNRRFSLLTGYSAEEMIGRRAGSLLGEPGREAEARERVRAGLRSGAPFTVETMVRRRDGRSFWLRLSAYPVRDGEGRLGGYLGIGRDATELQALSRALQLERAFLRTVIDTVPHAIYWRDSDSLFLGCNRTAAGLLGVPSPEAIVGHDDLSLGFSREAAAHARACDLALLRGEVERTDKEEPITLPGGERIFQISKVPLRGEDGAVKGVLGVAVDVTTERAAVEALRRSEERAALAFHGSGDGVSDWDARAQRAYFSPRFYELLRCTPQELGDGPDCLRSRIHPDDLPRVLYAWTRHAAGEEPSYQAEQRMRCGDGVYRWFLHRAKAVARAADGVPLRVVGTLSDISERKHLEDSLRRAKGEAEAAARAKSDFLATMSHELRTPMNGILGFTALLLDTPLSAEQQSYLEMIHRSGEGLLRIINDILDLGKLEAGKFQVEELPFDLRQTVSEAVDLVRHRAEDKGVALEVDLDPRGPSWVLSDPGRLRQVLLNLLSNAVKFTERGRVRVEVRGEAAPARFTVRVQDSGVGIPRERQGALFSRFTQADASTARRFGGTGLGLAICRELVTLLGGTMGLESQEGRGSTFWFELPWRAVEEPAAVLAEAAAEGAAAPGEPEAAPPPRLRVLAADDNPTNRLLIRRLVEKLGGDITVAANGLEAVRLFEELPFDLILMDCQMPELNGLEATTRIRELEARRGTGGRVPIVALTASCLPEDRARCLEAGMDDYLSKPIRPAELRQVLARRAPAPPMEPAPSAGAGGAAPQA